MLLLDILLKAIANISIITLVSYLFVKLLPKKKTYELSWKRKISIVVVSSLTTFILMSFAVNLPQAVKIDMRFNVLILLLYYFGPGIFLPTTLITGLLRLTWGINEATIYTFILYLVLGTIMPFLKKWLTGYLSKFGIVLVLNALYISCHALTLLLLFDDLYQIIVIALTNFLFSSACLILVIFCVEDMLRARSLYMEAKERAKSDFLTGLYNKGAFSRRWEKIENNPTIHQTAFLMLDIDYFKNINDQYGHINGDLVLQQLADLLHTQHVDYSDIYRVGGEEFCIILNNVSETKQRKIAEDIRSSIEHMPFQLENHEIIYLTVSIGLATSGKEKNMKRLYRLADKALYLAKESGRNQVVTLEEAK